MPGVINQLSGGPNSAIQFFDDGSISIIPKSGTTVTIQNLSIGSLGSGATINEPIQGGLGAAASIVKGADSSQASPISTTNPAMVYDTFRAGDNLTIAYVFNTYKQSGQGDVFNLYPYTNYTVNMAGFPASNINLHNFRSVIDVNPTNLVGTLIGYSAWIEAYMSAAGTRVIGLQLDTKNNTVGDASQDIAGLNNTFNLAFNFGAGRHNTTMILSQGVAATSAYYAWAFGANSFCNYGFDFTRGFCDLSGTVSVQQGSANFTGAGSLFTKELVRLDQLNVGGVFQTVDTFPTNGTGTFTAPFSIPVATITGATNANPIVIGTATAHGFPNGSQVTIAGVTGNTAANGTWAITVLSSTTFSIPVAGNGAYAGGGTATFVSATVAATKYPVPMVLASPSFIMAEANDLSARYRMAGLRPTTNDWSFDPDARGAIFGGQLTAVGFCAGKAIVALANGDNNNVNISSASIVRIGGPTAGYAITGFTGGADGRLIFVFNSVAQQLTIKNENAGSTAANRIVTLTGADVVLRAGQSFATFEYDGSSSRWILVSTN